MTPKKALYYNLRRGTFDSTDGELKEVYSPDDGGYYLQRLSDWAVSDRVFKTSQGLDRAYRAGRVNFPPVIPGLPAGRAGSNRRRNPDSIAGGQ